MIHHLSGCDMCGYRLPEPIEIETESWQEVRIQHINYEGEPLHMLVLPRDFTAADMEQVRTVLAKAMLGQEGKQ